jgi:uncharacterized membrane protein YqhA
MSYLVKVFEWVLWESRLIVLIAVIASIASAVVLIAFGTMDIYVVIKLVGKALGNHDEFAAIQYKVLSTIVSAMDLYLIATVLLIFGLGLYELFINKIDRIEFDESSSGILKIHSLDELKAKLLGVIHVVLVVYFFKYALNWSIKQFKTYYISLLQFCSWPLLYI